MEQRRISSHRGFKDRCADGITPSRTSVGRRPKVIQERLGYSSVAFTLDVYSHAIPTMQGEAAQKVAALFDQAT